MELQEADAASGVGLDAEQNHAQHGFPRTASARNNLTALSQRYNVGRALAGGDAGGCANSVLPGSSISQHTRTGFMSTSRGGPGRIFCPLRH